ncbi:uncharacterized protein LOC129306585 isoform X2 [Prosopis cineraria]|uniref:uncharacterized protein LOC129306585 isoform X2 n=1 Tax=Prosopis cineraria TaxID=364024 RepID=UPI00241037DF|nr:uncharacterized protein LOC129306585 isoform X2 [Prosopis cineraria]
MKTVTSSSLSLISQPCSGISPCYYSASYSSSLTSAAASSPHRTIVAKSKKQYEASKGSESYPPRITSNVKQNLQFLRLWKEFQKRKSGTPRPSTSYRKKKVEKEDVPEDTDLYRDPTLNLYYTNQGIDNAVPVLLVDGYNVCGYWMKLKKHFMKGRLDIARQKLIDELVTFSMLRVLSGLPTHKENFAGVDVVFSAETCADTWIETEVAALKEDGCPKVWVVSSDHCHQQAAHGAGAYVWSCKALVTEIKASQKEVEIMLKEQRSTSFQGRLLKHNLDAEVVDALKDLRQKLSQNQMK